MEGRGTVSPVVNSVGNTDERGCRGVSKEVGQTITLTCFSVVILFSHILV